MFWKTSPLMSDKMLHKLGFVCTKQAVSKKITLNRAKSFHKIPASNIFFCRWHAQMPRRSLDRKRKTFKSPIAFAACGSPVKFTIHAKKNLTRIVHNWQYFPSFHAYFIPPGVAAQAVPWKCIYRGILCWYVNSFGYFFSLLVSPRRCPPWPSTCIMCSQNISNFFFC